MKHVAMGAVFAIAASALIVTSAHAAVCWKIEFTRSNGTVIKCDNGTTELVTYEDNVGGYERVFITAGGSIQRTTFEAAANEVCGC